MVNFITYDVLGKAKGKQSVPDLLDAASENLEERFKEAPLVEASTRKALGLSYQSMGKYKAAQTHLERALEIQRRVLGEGHTKTLSSMGDLVVLYYKQGHYDEMNALLKKIVKTQLRGWEERQRHLGWWDKIVEKYSYEDTTLGLIIALLDYMYRGDQWLDEGRMDDIWEQWGLMVLSLSRITDGEEHPDRLKTMHTLAEIYTWQRRYDDAEPLLLKALEGRSRVLGEEHPDTLSTINSLIELYEAWGKPKKAEQWRAKLPRKEDIKEQQ